MYRLKDKARFFHFFFFLLLSNSIVVSQQIPNFGGVLEFNYVEGNNYDFISGDSKLSSKSFLDFRLKAWNPNDKNTQLISVLTNIPATYSSQFIFYPRYQYDNLGRPRPMGRGSGVKSWISLYGSFTEHNPADWKKSSYNWPYGGQSLTARSYWKNRSTITLDLLESTNWKYPKISYSSSGSLENSLYQYTWSTTSDYYRERSNAGKGSIPGSNDPKQEFFIPDGFWNNHSYAHIQATTSAVQEINPFMDVNYKTFGNGRLDFFHTYDTFIFPYSVNGQKTTLINDSPEVYYFGQQGAYGGSEATFLSFAQDSDGDQLFYRWVDGTNFSESQKYTQSNNNNFLYEFKNGYSADKPLKKDTTDSDYFYINPYSGTVNFINSTDPGFKRSFVAIDQYKDGQLIGTTINQVSFISQTKSSSNNRPIISISSTTDVIAQKTSFDYDTDIYISSDAITPPTEIKPFIGDNITRSRVPYKQVNNNGELLLEGLDAGENETVSFDIAVSDPNSDTVTLEVLSVDSDLIETYPWTVTSTANNTYRFEWTTPENLDTETTLGSKSYLFMLYAKDDNEVLDGLPGRTLKPVSITVHKKPSVVITSSDVVSGDLSNDNSINLTITLSDIDTSSLSDSSFNLTADAFDLTNATLTELSKINNYSYAAKLNVDPNTDPTLAPVNTSVKIDNNQFSISMIGGHGINQVSLSNNASNLFEWTSDQTRPIVTFDFFDSDGESLANSTKTNDPFIVGKISVSKLVDGFTDGDLSITNTNISSSELQKVEDVDETYYIVKINATDNTIGNVDFSIPENIFSDNLGNQNQKGTLTTDSSITNFIWDFDLIKPTLTITNPFTNLNAATTATNGAFTFSFTETVSYKNKTLENLTNPDIENLIADLNANTTNAFFSNFVFDSNNPNQFNLTVNHGGGNRTVTLNVPKDFVQDLYGNNLSSEESLTYTYNLDFPRLSNIYNTSKSRSGSYGPYTYSQGNELTYLTSSAPVDILISFLGQSQNDALNRNDIGYQSKDSGLPFTIANSDIVISSGTLSNLQYFGLGSNLDDSGNLEQLFRATYTPNASYNGFVSFSIVSGTFTNTSAVSNIYSNKQILVDSTTPSVTFKVVTRYNTPFSKQDITNEEFLLVEAIFSEPVEDFTIEDLINGNYYSHKFPNITEFTKINDRRYSFKVKHLSGDGEYSFVDKIQSYADKQGLKNNTQDVFKWYFDTTSPALEIQVYNGENAIKDQEYSANSSVEVKYVFSEPGISIIDSALDLVQLLNTNAQNITFSTAIFDSENKTITAQGTISSVGQVNIGLSENLFKDRGGNLNSSASERSYFYDNSVPEPTITVSNGSSPLQNNTTFNATSLNVIYDFSVALGATKYSEYSNSELQEILSSQISNGELSNLQKVDDDTLSGTISNFDNGEIIIGFPEDLVFTTSGIKNTKANKITFYLDNVAPKAVLVLNNSNGESIEEGSLINNATVYAKITLTEPTNNLTLNDFSFSSNVSASQFVKEDDYTYSFELNNSTSGAITITLASNSFSDSVGNFNKESIQKSYDFDNTRPIPSISSSLLTNGATTNATIVPIEITFNENVFFTQAEDRLESYISTQIENGLLSDYSKNGNTIRFNINRLANGTTSLTLPENVFNDSHSNGNTAATFGFTFEGSITLTKVQLDSNNPLEEDYTLSYTSSGNNISTTVPGTRSLLNNGDIDYLYVNNDHELTLSIVSEAAIIITGITINGQAVSATNQNGNSTEWEAVYNLSSATTEGIVDFQIEFTDTNGVAQTPVNKTTDDIYYKKDFTPPVLTAKIFQGESEVDYQNDPLLNAKHKFVLTANETLYAEKAFTQVNNLNYTGDLARFAAMIQLKMAYFSLTGYHNTAISTRISSNLVFEFGNWGNYYNSPDDFNDFTTYTDNNLILFPKFGTGSYDLTVPNDYFFDLAGNKTSGFTLSNLTLLSSANSAKTKADIKKKSCEYTTSATVNHRLNISKDRTYESIVTVELSNNEVFSTSETLGAERIREIESTTNTSSTTYTYAIELDKDYELDLEESTWVRFKVVNSITSSYSTQEIISYSQPVYITVNPITTELSGPDGICGLNETETFTVNTTGGSWSVSDNSVATITSDTGVLTTLSAGTIDVIYTTTDGCNYLKKIEVFDTPSVTITANGQTNFCEGASISLVSSVTDVDKIIWYKDNVVQTQLTASTVTLNNTGDSGVYHIGLITPCGTTVSNKITIKINELPNASKISTND